MSIFDPLHQLFRNHIFRDRKYQHLVIGQNTILNSVGEINSIEFFAIDSFIIHRAKDAIVLARFDLGTFTIEARRSRHIQALLTLNKFIAVNLGKVAFILRGDFHACGAMRFVANDKVKHAKLTVRIFQYGGLCFGHDVDALIGREYHRYAIVYLVRYELFGDEAGICRGWES